MLAEDATFSMPPLATWFGGRATRSRPSSSAGRCRAQWRWQPRRECAPTASRRSPSTAGTRTSSAYLPFALNVLTFRGEQISDVTAFIIRTPPEDDDREIIARLPEQPTDPARLFAAFERFGLPERLT